MDIMGAFYPTIVNGEMPSINKLTELFLKTKKRGIGSWLQVFMDVFLRIRTVAIAMAMIIAIPVATM